MKQAILVTAIFLACCTYAQAGKDEIIVNLCDVLPCSTDVGELKSVYISMVTDVNGKSSFVLTPYPSRLMQSATSTLDLLKLVIQTLGIEGVDGVGVLDLMAASEERSVSCRIFTTGGNQ